MSFIPPPSAIRTMMSNAPADALNLGIGEPCFPTPQVILDYVKKNIDYWHLGYSANAGLPQLRELIAGSFGSHVKSEQICVTCGAQEALYTACHTLLAPGDEALVPDPGFLAYGTLVRSTGAEPIDYVMPASPAERFDPEALAKRITSRTKVIFINSPANPTGGVLKEDEVKFITDLCTRHHITIISDEVYRQLYYGDIQPQGFADYSDNCIVISSLSKTFSMTGWRLGWALCPDSIASSFIRVHQYLTTCASVIAQHAAIFIFQGHADETVIEMRGALKARRDLLANELGKEGNWQVEKPEAGIFIFVKIPDGFNQNSYDAAQGLLDRSNVITIPGGAFGNRGEKFLRLSFAVDEKTIQQACERLKKLRQNPL